MLSPSDFNNAVPQFTNGTYASNPINPQYVNEPTSTEYNQGVEPLQTLPAQWWNWFINKFTGRFNKINTYVKNIFNELTQLLSLGNITPDGTEATPTTCQLKDMFASCYPDYVKCCTTGTACGCIPIIGTDLGTTNNNILVTDASGQLKPSGITVGTAAGCDASCFLTCDAAVDRARFLLGAEICDPDTHEVCASMVAYLDDEWALKGVICCCTPRPTPIIYGGICVACAGCAQRSETTEYACGLNSTTGCWTTVRVCGCTGNIAYLRAVCRNCISCVYCTCVDVAKSVTLIKNGLVACWHYCNGNTCCAFLYNKCNFPLLVQGAAGSSNKCCCWSNVIGVCIGANSSSSCRLFLACYCCCCGSTYKANVSWMSDLNAIIVN